MSVYLTRKSFFWSITIFVTVLIAVFGFQSKSIDRVEAVVEKTEETFNRSVEKIGADVGNLRVDVGIIKAVIAFFA